MNTVPDQQTPGSPAAGADDGHRLRVVVVGHVDHGKSTLIGRLLRESGVSTTAADLAHATDQLAEERAGGLSMDTAQAYCRLRGRAFVFVDVPGHRELLRNMMTGATRADAAVLVVAADEGVREQTRRHAAVLALLGMGQVIVAVNKIDAVGYSAERFDAVRDDALELLGRLGCPAAMAVVPVSASRGCNVASPAADTPWYIGPTLLDALGEVQRPPREVGPARFVVQGAYPFRGTTAYAGRLIDGTVAAGDRLVCHPAGVALVERVLRFPPDDAPARAGESVALSLSGADPARGSVLAAASAEQPAVGCSLYARVFWLHPEPLHAGDRLLLRCATQEAGCAVQAVDRSLDTATLLVREAMTDGTCEAVGESDIADLVLSTDRPIVTEPFGCVAALGRFVLERDGVVAGAGVVSGPLSPVLGGEG